MFSFQCGIGRREDCLKIKPVCLARHIDDENHGYLEKSVANSVRRKVRNLRSGTTNPGKRYGMRVTDDRRARKTSKICRSSEDKDQVLLTLSFLQDGEDEEVYFSATETEDEQKRNKNYDLTEENQSRSKANEEKGDYESPAAAAVTPAAVTPAATAAAAVTTKSTAGDHEVEDNMVIDEIVKEIRNQTKSSNEDADIMVGDLIAEPFDVSTPKKMEEASEPINISTPDNIETDKTNGKEIDNKEESLRRAAETSIESYQNEDDGESSEREENTREASGESGNAGKHRAMENIWEDDNGMLEISIPCEYFHQIRIRGDGHCMVHSVMETLQIEDVGRAKIEVMKRMERMLYHDVDDIKTFTNHVDTDPRREMADYIRKGRYNAAIADLIIPLLSRALNVRIIILHKDHEERTYNLIHSSHHVFAPVGYEKTVYVQKQGMHYNSLLPKDVAEPQTKKQDYNNKEWRKSWTPSKICSPTYSRKTEQKECRRTKRVIQPSEKMELLQKENKEKSVKNNKKVMNDTTENGEKKKQAAVYCVCRKPDDGTKMVQCGKCKEWYHMACLNLTVRELNDMSKKKNQYVCSRCSVQQQKNDSQETRGKNDMSQKKLSNKIIELSEELRRLKKKEDERKIKESEEKMENRRKMDSLRDTLNKRNQRIEDQKSEIRKLKERTSKEIQDKNQEIEKHKQAEKQANKEIEKYKHAEKQANKSSGGKDNKVAEKLKKDMEEAKEQNKELTAKLKEAEKRCEELVKENELFDENEDENEANSETQTEKLKKELVRNRKYCKKIEKELDEARDSRNKALEANLEQVRTIRNLNDSLDLLKRINIDHERSNVSKAISAKTRDELKKLQEEEREMCKEQEVDQYELLDVCYNSDDDQDQGDADEEQEDAEQFDMDGEGWYEIGGGVEPSKDNTKDMDIFDIDGSEPDDRVDDEHSVHDRVDDEHRPCNRNPRSQRHELGNRNSGYNRNSGSGREDSRERRHNRRRESKSSERQIHGNGETYRRESRNSRRSDKDGRSRTNRYRSNSNYRNDERSSESKRYDRREQRPEHRSRDEQKDRSYKNEESYKKKVVCKYFVENRCEFGEDCWFSHDERLIKKEAERMKVKLSFLETSMRRTNQH